MNRNSIPQYTVYFFFLSQGFAIIQLFAVKAEQEWKNNNPKIEKNFKQSIENLYFNVNNSPLNCKCVCVHFSNFFLFYVSEMKQKKKTFINVPLRNINYQRMRN